mgnify:CR=1 FL=1
MAWLEQTRDFVLNWIANGYLNWSWWQILLITLLLTHITIASVTIFLHRCQAHRALELHAIPSHFFRFWLWLTTGMVTKEWAAIHRKHHAKCESIDDPHSPQVLGINTVLSRGAELYRAEAKNKETIEKFEDCIEYLTIKNSEDETIQKIDTIMEKSTDIFTTYINKTVPTLLKQSIGYTKEVWVRLRPIYLQTNPNSELISKIDDYAKQPEIINKVNSTSIWPILIGLVIGIYGMLWLIKMING